METGLARQRRIDAIGQDHDVGIDIAVDAVGLHTHHLVAVHDELIHRGLADQQGTGLAHLGTEPLVKLRPQNGVTVIGRLVVFLAADVCANKGVVVQHPHALLDDVALQRRVVTEVGDDFLQRLGIQDGALHVLAAGVFAAFDLQHLEAGLGQGVGAGIARGAGTDHDGVELGWLFHLVLL